jgi:alpha-mannosidase
VPALGYATYWAYLEAEKASFTNTLDIGPQYISNAHIEARFDKNTGNMISFKHKKTGREFVKGYAAKTWVIDDEAQDTWSHGVFTFDKIAGEFSEPVFEIIERGEVKVTLRVTQKYNTSEIRQDYTLYPHSTALEAAVRVTNNEKLRIFKLAFNLNTDRPTEAVYEIPYASITKKSNGEEEPAQNYACVDDGEIGLAVFNTGKYSHSVKGSELCFIAARSCVYADHYGVHSGMRDGLYEYQDQGVMYFKYSLYGYTGGYKKNAPDIVKRGMELNTPAYSIAETYHEGALPQLYSGISIDKDNIILTAAKNAEDNDGAVLRFVETAGEAAQVNIDAVFLNRKISAEFAPYEIKTFKITKTECLEVDLLEFEK